MGSLVTRAGGRCILMCRLRKRALAAFTEVYFPPAAILTGIKTETNLPIQAQLTEVHYRFVFPSPVSVRCWPLPAAQTQQWDPVAVPWLRSGIELLQALSFIIIAFRWTAGRCVRSGHCGAINLWLQLGKEDRQGSGRGDTAPSQRCCLWGNSAPQWNAIHVHMDAIMSKYDWRAPHSKILVLFLLSFPSPSREFAPFIGLFQGSFTVLPILRKLPWHLSVPLCGCLLILIQLLKGMRKPAQPCWNAGGFIVSYFI